MTTPTGSRSAFSLGQVLHRVAALRHEDSAPDRHRKFQRTAAAAIKGKG